MLRQSQLIRLEYGIVESTMQLSEFLASWINAISIFAEVHVYSAMGNHSEIRPLRSKNREFEDENLEKVMKLLDAETEETKEYGYADLYFWFVIPLAALVVYEFISVKRRT